MTNDIQAAFSAAGEERAEQIRAAHAAKLAQAEQKQARTTQGADFLRAQFEVLAADGTPEPPLPTSTPDDADIFNILPRF